ncbi:hypothetical protein NBRC110019_12630 [Neptunitalea chrysea]|uniref:SRPBCC family protein n=1 Tax=Neptunitalea chrysea TaxID=1647581 RepID=A0A9W6B457_9FLAO|nr:SRPBCC family protein [Neptunitalea chrysea]GLB52224.1 hypothetical protein NBRC110019_12630 [Neptunitalea chrysea]
MKYTLEIAIQKPIEAVAESFDSLENLKHWQRGFQKLEPLSGTPGEEGSKSKLIFKTGKRDIEMIETIVKKNMPHEFHCTYETKGVYNIQENYFEILDANATKWISKSEFRFTNFIFKVYSFLMPGSFKKQSYIFMKDFKNYLEKGTSVA